MERPFGGNGVDAGKHTLERALEKRGACRSRASRFVVVAIPLHARPRGNHDMPRQRFVNLPAKDLDRSVALFTVPGFAFDPRFTHHDATCT